MTVKKKDMILIVDDQSANLKVLFSFLQEQEFDIRILESGEQLLEMLTHTLPDIILLDVMMPGMDGFTVCRKIKQDPRSTAIPVIFLTALDEVEVKVAGFEAGGVDYITKPFQKVEVLARLKTHLTLQSRQRKVEQALKQQHNLTRIIEKSLNEIYLFDATSYHFVFVNEGARKNTGYSLAEFLKMTPVDILPDVDTAFFMERILPLQKEQQEKIIFETILRRKDGSTYPTEVHLQQTEYNSMPVFAAIILDISQRKQMEQRYRELVEGTTDLISQVDGEGNLLYVNHMGKEIFGSDPAQLTGQSAFQFVHPDDRELTTAWFENCQNRHLPLASIENRQVNQKTGHVHDMLWNVNFHYDDEGQLVSINSIAHDITARKQFETAIRRSEKQWHRTFNSFTDIVTLQDTNLRIVKGNQAACTALGLSCDAIVGHHCYELFHGSDEPYQECPLLQSRDRFEPYSREMYHETLGKTFLVAAVPVFDEVGALEYIAHVAKDITLWKRAEKQLILSEKMASVTGLAAGVAHEINTPLSGILQSIHIIEKELDPDCPRNLKVAARHGLNLQAVQTYFKEKELDYFIAGISSSAITAAKTIKGLLDFSRPPKGHFTPRNLNAIIHNSLALARSDHELQNKFDIQNVTISEEYDPDLTMVVCMGVEMQQVMLNLIKNAVQAMVEQENRKRRIILLTKKTGTVARIEVEDNGPGMDNETRSQIFNPFFTTKEVGSATGLGLSVSYSIICDKHHGKIWVESEPEKGARFIMELPLSQEGLDTRTQTVRKLS